ncbi:hypothetical protein QUR95_00160 [Candidatus Nasuia deltocephalinicola]|nr:hypothetical protein QUR95_00160 [Candidatus Nasuia deltocephalinicola]
MITIFRKNLINILKFSKLLVGSIIKLLNSSSIFKYTHLLKILFPIIL